MNNPYKVHKGVMFRLKGDRSRQIWTAIGTPLKSGRFGMENGAGETVLVEYEDVSEVAQVIRDKSGYVVSRSRNLRGIRQYVSGHTPPIIKMLSVSPIGDGEGKLLILFENGNSYEANFASFVVLKQFVRAWKDIHGSPFWYDGKRCGEVTRNNPHLQ